MSLSIKKEGFAGQKSCVVPDSIRKNAKEEPLSKALYITDIGFYPNAQYHSRERNKGCKENILIYCVDGEGWCFAHHQKIKIVANQAIILPQGTPHKYGADRKNPWSIYWIHFAGKNALKVSQHLLKNKFKPFDVPIYEMRNLLFDHLFSLVEVAGKMDNLIDISLIFPYYLTSFKQSILPSKVVDKKYDPIEKSITFMKANLPKNFSLREFASQAALSVSHYSALFQLKTKHSPINYFVFLKMQYACQLLENTEFSIKQIGLELAYEDPFHFSRTFKNVIGVSPRGFRLR